MFRVLLLAGVVARAADSQTDCSGEEFLMSGPMVVLANSEVEHTEGQRAEELQTCVMFAASFIYGRQKLCNGNFYKVVGLTGYDYPSVRSKAILYDAYGPLVVVTRRSWKGVLSTFKCFDDDSNSLTNSYKFVAVPVSTDVCLVAAIKGDIVQYFSFFSHDNKSCTEVNSLIKEVEAQGYELFGKKLEPTCCHYS